MQTEIKTAVDIASEGGIIIPLRDTGKYELTARIDIELDTLSLQMSGVDVTILNKIRNRIDLDYIQMESLWKLLPKYVYDYANEHPDRKFIMQHTYIVIEDTFFHLESGVFFARVALYK